MFDNRRLFFLGCWNHGKGNNISTVWSLEKSFPTKTEKHKCAYRQVGETLLAYLTVTVWSSNTLPSYLGFLLDLVSVSSFLFHDKGSHCSLSWCSTVFCPAWLQALDPRVPAIPAPRFQVYYHACLFTDFLRCLRWWSMQVWGFFVSCGELGESVF